MKALDEEGSRMFRLLACALGEVHTAPETQAEEVNTLIKFSLLVGSLQVAPNCLHLWDIVSRFFPCQLQQVVFFVHSP